MGEVINLWSWRKPDRKNLEEKPAAQPPAKLSLPTSQGTVLETYLRSFLQRLKEGMAATLNPLFVAVDTTHVNVSMPDWLRKQYPYEINIVLQNRYENLNVSAAGFSVRLRFSDTPCDLFFPFCAVKRVIDQRAGLALDRIPLGHKDGPWGA